MEIQRLHYVLSLIEGVVSINVSSRPNNWDKWNGKKLEHRVDGAAVRITIWWLHVASGFTFVIKYLDIVDYLLTGRFNPTIHLWYSGPPAHDLVRWGKYIAINTIQRTKMCITKVWTVQVHSIHAMMKRIEMKESLRSIEVRAQRRCELLLASADWALWEAFDSSRHLDHREGGRC